MSSFRQLLESSTIYQKPYVLVPPTESQAIAAALTAGDIPDVIAVLDGTYAEWEGLQGAERTEERSIDDEIDECYFYSQKIDAIVDAITHLPAAAFFAGMHSPHRFTRATMASAIERLATPGDLDEVRQFAEREPEETIRKKLEAVAARIGPVAAQTQPSEARVKLRLWLAVAAIVLLFAVIFVVADAIGV